MPNAYPLALEAFLLDENASALYEAEPKAWRRLAWERAAGEFSGDWLILARRFGFDEAEDQVQAFYLRELTARRTVLEQWTPARGSLRCYLKKVFLNFLRDVHRDDKRRAKILRPWHDAYDVVLAASPDATDPLRLLLRREVEADSPRARATPAELAVKLEAFRQDCVARGLSHYWTVFERHDLRPEAFGHPRHEDTAAALGCTRRDVTNWLVRARRRLRSYVK